MGDSKQAMGDNETRQEPVCWVVHGGMENASPHQIHPADHINQRNPAPHS